MYKRNVGLSVKYEQFNYKYKFWYKLINKEYKHATEIYTLPLATSKDHAWIKKNPDYQD